MILIPLFAMSDSATSACCVAATIASPSSRTSRAKREGTPKSRVLVLREDIVRLIKHKNMPQDFSCARVVLAKLRDCIQREQTESLLIITKSLEFEHDGSAQELPDTTSRVVQCQTVGKCPPSF